MKNIKDYSNKKYGKLIVKYAFRDKLKNKTMAFCECECGKTKIISMGNLQSGKTKSCGCGHKKHHQTNTRLYNIWKGIKQRCYNKNNQAYKYYGKRNIIMCDIWKNDFISFMEWALENGYEKNLTIDRIDVNGNYCPENCRWITSAQQNTNKRTYKKIFYENELYSAKEFSKKFGIKYRTLMWRLNQNWDVENLLKRRFVNAKIQCSKN